MCPAGCSPRRLCVRDFLCCQGFADDFFSRTAEASARLCEQNIAESFFRCELDGVCGKTNCSGKKCGVKGTNQRRVSSDCALCDLLLLFGFALLPQKRRRQTGHLPTSSLVLCTHNALQLKDSRRQTLRRKHVSALTNVHVGQ